jgi:hypothetical protein
LKKKLMPRKARLATRLTDETRATTEIVDLLRRVAAQGKIGAHH